MKHRLSVPETPSSQSKAMTSHIQYTTAQLIGAAAIDPPFVRLPVIGARARLGFPSPADDFLDDTLDLNNLLIRNPAATFFYRAHGNSMLRAGILSGISWSLTDRYRSKMGISCWQAGVARLLSAKSCEDFQIGSSCIRPIPTTRS